MAQAQNRAPGTSAPRGARGGGGAPRRSAPARARACARPRPPVRPPAARPRTRPPPPARPPARPPPAGVRPPAARLRGRTPAARLRARPPPARAPARRPPARAPARLPPVCARALRTCWYSRRGLAYLAASSGWWASRKGSRCSNPVHASTMSASKGGAPSANSTRPGARWYAPRCRRAPCSTAASTKPELLLPYLLGGRTGAWVGGGRGLGGGVGVGRRCDGRAASGGRTAPPDAARWGALMARHPHLLNGLVPCSLLRAIIVTMTWLVVGLGTRKRACTCLPRLMQASMAPPSASGLE
jgi:hypothetical protein